jgi:hypothetical protein
MIRLEVASGEGYELLTLEVFNRQPSRDVTRADSIGPSIRLRCSNNNNI